MAEVLASRSIPPKAKKIIEAKGISLETFPPLLPDSSFVRMVSTEKPRAVLVSERTPLHADLITAMTGLWAIGAFNLSNGVIDEATASSRGILTFTQSRDTAPDVLTGAQIVATAISRHLSAGDAVGASNCARLEVSALELDGSRIIHITRPDALNDRMRNSVLKNVGVTPLRYAYNPSFPYVKPAKPLEIAVLDLDGPAPNELLSELNNLPTTLRVSVI